MMSTYHSVLNHGLHLAAASDTPEYARSSLSFGLTYCSVAEMGLSDLPQKRINYVFGLSLTHVENEENYLRRKSSHNSRAGQTC